MEVGFGIYGFCGGSAFDLEEKQCNMGSCGPTHQNGALHSHVKHLDIGIDLLGLSRGDCWVTWSTSFFGVQPGHMISVELLAEVTGGIRNITQFQQGVLSGDICTDGINNLNV